MFRRAAFVLLGALIASQTVWGAGQVFAQRERQREPRQNRSTLPGERQELRQTFQERRQELREGLKEQGQTIRAEGEKRIRALQEEARGRRQELQSQFKEKREQFREKARERIEELRKKLGEKRAERIEQFFLQMVRKFEQAIDRLNSFADRIEGRINQAAEVGKDVASARAKLETARQRISEAQTALQDTRAKYSEAVQNQDFRVAFQRVREVVAGLKDAMKSTHGSLVDVITTLKGVGGGSERESTSTPPPAPPVAP